MLALNLVARSRRLIPILITAYHLFWKNKVLLVKLELNVAGFKVTSWREFHLPIILLMSSTFLDLNRLRPGQLSVIQKLHYWRAFLQFLNVLNLSWKTMLAFLSRFYNQYLGQSGLGWYENFCHLH